jgi:copper chaperone CopZ
MNTIYKPVIRYNTSITGISIMNRTLLSVVLALFLALPAFAREVKTETISLPTLQCGMCKKNIESKLSGMQGLDSITVSVDEKTATVVYDAAVTSIEKIEEAISMAGYDANETKADRKAQRKLHACCQPGAHD